MEQETRLTHLVKTALQVYKQKGIGRTKIKDIAAAAAVSKSTIYKYFTGKEQILWAVADACLRDHAEKCTYLAEHCSADPLGTLLHYLDSLVGVVQTGSKELFIISKLFHESYISKRRNGIYTGLEAYGEVFKPVYAMLEKIIAAGIEKKLFKPRVKHVHIYLYAVIRTIPMCLLFSPERKKLDLTAARVKAWTLLLLGVNSE